MVTSNSGEGRSREGKVYTVDNRRSSERKDRPERKDYRKNNRNNEEGRGGSREGYKGNSKGDRKPGYAGKGKNEYSSSKSSGSRGYNPYDKDRNEDVRPNNRTKSSQKDSKKEQQPDKIEIMNRIEKEKKAIQKKQAENRKNNRPVRQQAKPKRSNNIDWTREYENGSYDDDDLDMYL